MENCIKKSFKVTFPTLESLEYFKSLKIVDNKKLFCYMILYLLLKDLIQKKNEPIDDELNLKK